MRKLLFTLTSLIITSICFSQPVVKIDSVKNHVDEIVKVCTKIYGGKYLQNSKSAPTFLDAGDNYPNQPLTFYK